MQFVRLMMAAAWTVAFGILMVIVLGLSMMGDCPEDVITGTHAGPCIDHKRMVGWIILIAGFAIWVAVNWLILRKRSR